MTEKAKPKRASINALGALHEKLAMVMSEALDGESFVDEETGETTSFKATNPALFTAVAKFLKDNDVVAIPETEDAVTQLRDQLEKRNRKTTLPIPTKEDIQWPQERATH
jgi:hypothetical protein